MDRIDYKPKSVLEAKQQLREKSMQVNYLSPVINSIKGSPIKIVSSVFIAGVLLNKLSKGSLPPSLLSLAITLLRKL